MSSLPDSQTVTIAARVCVQEAATVIVTSNEKGEENTVIVVIV